MKLKHLIYFIVLCLLCNLDINAQEASKKDSIFQTFSTLEKFDYILSDLGRIKMDYFDMDSTNMTMNMHMWFHMNDEIIEMMAKDIYEDSLQAFDGSEFVATDRFKNVKDCTFSFDKIKFEWFEEDMRFIARSPIRITYMRETAVNKILQGLIVIQYKSYESSDMILYLSGTSEKFNYFRYKNSIMQLYSSNSEINNVLINLKADKRKLKQKKGLARYIYQIGASKSVSLFHEEYGKELKLSE